jgi:photosystem II stability/assembly factor-like uncharacterized protein
MRRPALPLGDVRICGIVPSAMISIQLLQRAALKPGLWLALVVLLLGAIALAWAGALVPLRSQGVTLVGEIDTQDAHVLAIIDESTESLLLGHHDGLVTSGDGGRTWSSVLSGRDVMALASAVDGPHIVAGHGFIGTTSRSGEMQPLPATPEDLDIHAATRSLADPDWIWLATASGELVRSNDGGADWIEIFKGPIVQIASFGDDPRHLYAVHAFRGLIRSEDAGLTWSEGRGLPGSPVYSMAASLDGGSLVIGTGDGGYLSDDAGASWRRIIESPVSAVAIGATGTVAFLVTTDGELYRYHRD